MGYGLFTGKVVNGRQIGRTIGFPTANLAGKNLPDLIHGVYDVRVSWKGQTWSGVMNVGNRPTIEERPHNVSYEVHLIDFSEFIYGEELVIEVCGFLREEKKFTDVEKLIKQIREDIQLVRKKSQSYDSLKSEAG